MFKFKKRGLPNKSDKRQVSYRQLSQISDSALLEESNHLRLISQSILVITMLVVLFIIWAALVTLDEVTTTFGELTPTGHVQVVQHLEGGIITKVLVKNGDVVQRGQLLVELNVEQQAAELRQLRSQEISLILDSSRLNAFLQNKPADIAVWADEVVKSKYNPVKHHQQIATLLSDQKRLLDQQYSSLQAQKEGLISMIEQRQEKLKELVNQRKIWKRHIALLIQEFNMYQKLKQKNYISQKDYLTVLRSVNQAKGDGSRIAGEIEQTQDAITESRNKLAEVISNARRDALERLSKINSELLDIRHRIEKLSDRVRRAKIEAAISGTIKGLDAFPGNVVKPGGTLMEIVPQGEALQVECKILPRNIGYTEVGAKVKVKVLTYDYSRYGSINGKLKDISASTFTDKEGKPYYKAIVSLEKQYVGRENNFHELKAGMTVQADIVTGKKTLIEYLLKPIHRSLTESFRER